MICLYNILYNAFIIFFIMCFIIFFIICLYNVSLYCLYNLPPLMKISLVPITHRIKHLQPIFSFTKGNNNFCSAGINGELKLWNPDYSLIKTVKKHSGCVTEARFSLDSRFLASAGDDGRVIVMDAEAKDVLKTLKHPCDVTHIAWTPDFLLSSNLAGEVVVNRIADGFSELKRLKAHSTGILGMAVCGDHLCTYSEDTLVLYEHFKETARKHIEKGGVILENLQCKLSFSPNGKFISLGLQFNRKQPTVDILDLELNTLYSLVGHVAPCEVTAFCPLGLKNEGVSHSVLAVASQDLSLSLWSTVNPRPFLLVKNLTEQPILDLFWDELSLYVSSYDGVVKKLEFEAKELGHPGKAEEEAAFEMPFSEENAEMQRNYERRLERLDFGEKIEVIKLGDLILCGDNNDQLNKTRVVDALSKEDNNSVIVNNNINSDVINNDNNSASTLNPIITPAPKRIMPVMVDKPKSAPVISKTNSSFIVLYDANLPEKLKITKTSPFSQTYGDFTVTLSPSTSLTVLRASRPLYSISGPCHKVCLNETFLAVYTTHVQVYCLETGTLILPFISIRLAFMDLLDSNLLLLDSYGDFTVLNLTTGKALNGKLPKTKGLVRIQLNSSHFLLAQYDDGELLFYRRKLKTWLAINPRFNSITTTDLDIYNDHDDTIAELELCFCHYRVIGDQQGMKTVIKQIVALLMRIRRMEEYVEYKVWEMLKEIEDKKFIKMILEELNRESVFQRFVFKMMDVLFSNTS